MAKIAKALGVSIEDLLK
ncbi:MAG: hypothetical protein ACYC6G_09740 [Desulfobaccales bacterium]